MKLRNKKTGKIVEYDGIGFRKGQSNGWEDFIPMADSITAFNEVWEDYAPAEPLIKDEKVRKAVRAWAEANNITEVEYDKAGGTLVALRKPAKIIFNNSLDLNADEWAILGISELCGEEQE